MKKRFLNIVFVSLLFVNSSFSALERNVSGAVFLHPYGQPTTNGIIVSVNGNVGIGTTSPAANLQVSGNIAGTPIFQAGNAGAIGLIVSSNGNVGVGTTKPVNYLQVGGAGVNSNTAIVSIIGNTPSHLYDSGQLDVRTQESYAINKGGMISLGGNALANNNPYNFGVIGGYKENVTVSNFAGYLFFGTSDHYSNLYERVRIDSNGNVGIGTTGPNAKLEVFQTAGENLRLTKTGGAALSFFQGSISDAMFEGVSNGLRLYTGDSLTERVRVDSAGNVGIGTTAPSTKLEVAGTVSASALVVNGTITANRLIGDGSALTNLPTVSTANLALTSNIAISMNAQGLMGAISVATGNAIMSITTAGNVGIGTTSPTQMLSVGSGSPFNVTSAGVVTNAGETINGNLAIFPSSAVPVQIGLANGYGAKQGLVFASNGSTGYTSFGIINNQTAGRLSFATAPWNIGVNSDLATNWIETMSITSAGNVGIGTTAPGQSLHVYNGNGATGYKTARFDSNDTANGTRIVVSNSGNTAANNYGFVSGGTLLGVDKFSIARLNTDSVYSDLDMMVFDTAGNVGIGTTAPSTKLEVAGTVSASAVQARIIPRVLSMASSSAPNINTDLYDCVSITALAADIATFTMSGTPVDFDKLMIRIKDNGTARAITWGSSFEAKGVGLPTTTTQGKVSTVGFLFDVVTGKWGCVAVTTEQ